MPFGKKPDATGKIIDFDYVYSEFIKKVLDKTGLIPVRADEEMIGGIIHKPMYERLVLCDFAIADLSAGNPNVFYELGVRYTAKPQTTFPIYESETKIPFDLTDVRCFPYTLDGGKIRDLDDKIEKLAGYINAHKANRPVDSPIYQLLDGIEFTHKLSREKVEMLHTQSESDEKVRAEISDIVDSAENNEEKARKIGELENRLGDKSDWQTGISVAMMMAYRSVEDHKGMVQLIESLPDFLQKTVLIQEQYGFALNRAGNKNKAITVLQQLIDVNGPSSETCGILGRVYKDMYNEARERKPLLAAGFLDKAIETYMMGYKADMRDYYPGVNAVSLLAVKNDPAARDLAKVVEFSVNTSLDKAGRRQGLNREGTIDDYWPYATLLELAVIQGDQKKAGDYLIKSLVTKNELWQRKTTANNLRMYAGDGNWVKEIAEQLVAE